MVFVISERVEVGEGYPRRESVERARVWWLVRTRCHGDSGVKGRNSKRMGGKKNCREKGIL